MEDASVADTKDAGSTYAEGEATTGYTCSVKGLASSVEGAAIEDAKESVSPDAEGASTPVDAGLVNSISAAEGLACYLESSVVATADDAGDAVESVDTSVDTCWDKGVAAANDVAAAKGVASAVADTKDAGAIEDFDRIWDCRSVDIAADTADDVAATAAEGVDASVDASAVDIAKGDDSDEDVDYVLAPRLVRFLFFFGPIVSTQCHRYRSRRYQLTVQVNITLHKEDHCMQNWITLISLQSKSQRTTLKRQ